MITILYVFDKCVLSKDIKANNPPETFN